MKRFIKLDDGLDFTIKDNETNEIFYDCESVVELLNKLSEENTTLKERRHEDINELAVIAIKYNALKEENKELIQHIKKLEKQLYLVHMSSMFSTVQSFKGDVSKRYYYSEKTDRIYDTANNYGQYDKILEKKEIAMLLNEYETLLQEKGME